MITLYVDELFPNDNGGAVIDIRSVMHNRQVLQSHGRCFSLPELCIVGRFVCIATDDSGKLSQVYWNYKDGDQSIYAIMNLITDLEARNRLLKLYMTAISTQAFSEKVELVKGLPPMTSNN